MQQSNGVAPVRFPVRRVFAASGILVGLAIVVPIAGILMTPVVALAAWARAVRDTTSERGSGARVRPPAPSSPRRLPRALGGAFRRALPSGTSLPTAS